MQKFDDAHGYLSLLQIAKHLVHVAYEVHPSQFLALFTLQLIAGQRLDQLDQLGAIA